MSLHALVAKWRQQAGTNELNALEADSIGLSYNARVSEKCALIFTECADELEAALAGGGEAAPYRIWSIGGNQDGTATLSAVSEWRFFSERPFDTGDVVYVSRHPADAVQVDQTDWIRAWRNQFVSERTTTYQHNGDQYETARAKAEYDANTFEDGFTKALAALNPGGSRE